jgi:Glu-tRNA(Gln) amidotransferase subunit E-like FAD-binding protein
MVKDITKLLANTGSHILAETVKDGGVIMGLEVDEFNGVLIKNDKLSNLIQDEIAERAGVRGFISTDELPQYGLTAVDKKNILNAFGAGPKDVVVLVADKKEKAEAALKIIEEKIAARMARKAAAKPRKTAKPAKKAKPKKAGKAKKAKPKKAKKAAAKKKAKKR